MCMCKFLSQFGYRGKLIKFIAKIKTNSFNHILETPNISGLFGLKLVMYLYFSPSSL